MATILVVDDRPTNREFVTTLLGYNGHRLLEAGDGAEGLGIARAERPDLVIADILMPTMDGYEFVRQIRADKAIAQTRVIFFTAHYHEQEAQALARTCGVTSVLTKPCEAEVLLHTVEAALGLAPSTASPVAESFDRKHSRLLTDKLSQKVNELRRTNERLSALVELGLQLGSERNPPRLLRGFCHSARAIIGARYAIGGIVDGDGNQIRYLFTSGMDPETAARLKSPDPRKGVLNTVLRESRCLRLSNPSGDPVAIGFSSFHPKVHSWLGAPIISPAGVYGWIGLVDKIGTEAFSDEDERLAGILAAQVGRIYENGSMYVDVQRHAAALEQEVAERKRAEQRQAILLAASQALAESTTLREAAHGVLKAIGNNLVWELGSVWMVDRPANVLRCIEVWHAPGADYSEWEAHTRQIGLAPDVGLPGRVWRHGRPVWIADVTEHANFPRAAVAATEGLHAGFAFPILLGDEVLGVVEFFSPRFREPERDLLQVFASIGGNVGQFMVRKSAEEALRESDLQMRLLLDSTAEAIYGIDLEGNCTFCNRACWQLLGHASPADLLGKNMHALMHSKQADGTPNPVEHCRIYQAYRRNERTHVDDEVFWKADGTCFPAEYWSFPITRGEKIIGAVVTFLDITERKKLEEQFRQSKQRLQHVVASSPSVLYTLAINGQELRPTWISENVAEMLGYQVEDVFQPYWWRERMHPEDLQRALAEIRDELFGHNRLAQEYRFRHHDGTYRWLRSEMRLLRYKESQPTEVIGSWSDITARKLLEDQFRQAQKMEAVGRLAGGVAHDFNNLLTVINGYGELVLSQLPANLPARGLIREIVAAGDRAAGLTRQLLAFSRQAILEPKVLDLKVVVADVDKMLRRIIGEDVQLAVVAEPGLGAVKADPGQIEQVILNLVVNARDAMPQGGRCTIEVHNVDLDETYVQSHAEARKGPHVLLAVTDTGCGMDQPTMNRIFEPFFTTKGERGTGLGLATAHGIIKQSGGHLAVYSEVGHGTTIKVYLPRVDPIHPVIKSRAGRTMMVRGTETLLLVEDEDAVRALARHVLETCGYTVLTARDGAEAVSVAAQHQGRLDLLLTDVVLPHMGGREVSERVKAAHPEVKVLFLSGYTTDAVVRHGILEAQVAFLQKPFSPSTLASKVREVLDSR